MKPWPDIFPSWEGVKSVPILLLCLAVVSFSFSVAATNLFLGILLGIGILSGIWWRGVIHLWYNYHKLFISLVTYLGLVSVGLLWSQDFDWGTHILGRHWFWLLLPVIAVVLCSDRNRNAFLVTLSFGLTANLMFCVLQANGLIESPSVAGSTMVNATGHIGHTSFGFIYGVWAAWLLHVGFVSQNRVRWMLWALSAWAVMMVFMTEGKSGYIISLMCMLVVAIKWFQEAGSRRMFVGLSMLALLLLVFISLGPAKSRIQGTWQVLTDTVQQGEMTPSQENSVSSAVARLEWWKMSFHMWLDKPIAGYGTGSFPKAVTDWKASHVEERSYDVSLVHPHNQYLLSMVRWGGLGLASLLILLYSWVKVGTLKPWRESTTVPLIVLSGVALSVHGLSNASMEEHFSTIFAVLILGAGLSELLGERGA